MYVCKHEYNHDDNKVKDLIPDPWLCKPKFVLESPTLVLSVCLQKKEK